MTNATQELTRDELIAIERCIVGDPYDSYKPGELRVDVFHMEPMNGQLTFTIYRVGDDSTVPFSRVVYIPSIR